jgi:hypothetical protein
MKMKVAQLELLNSFLEPGIQNNFSQKCPNFDLLNQTTVRKHLLMTMRV